MERTTSSHFQPYLAGKIKYTQLYIDKVICACVGIGFLVFLPYMHLGVAYRYWNSVHFTVDKEKCRNTCWDSYFKGSYQDTISGYKHVYFNITPNTLKIWALTTLCVILVYECVCHLLLLYFNSKLRYSMLILILSSIYPHYYGWWMYFNAWNDDFYDQWMHQTYFSATELLCSMVVLYLCDLEHKIKPLPLLVILTISTLHIVTSSLDQFVTNILLHQGAGYQKVRDLGLMIPDVLHTLVSILYMIVESYQARRSVLHWLGHRQICCALLSLLLLLCIYKLL